MPYLGEAETLFGLSAILSREGQALGRTLLRGGELAAATRASIDQALRHHPEHRPSRDLREQLQRIRD